MASSVAEMKPLPRERAADGTAGTGQALVPFAFEASSLLKALGHEGRLMILGHLRDGAKSVAELNEVIPTSQSVISSHLARLRYEGLVRFRKEGKRHLYELADPRTRDMIDLITGVFCEGLKPHGAKAR